MHIGPRLKITIQPSDQCDLVLYLSQWLQRGRKFEWMDAHLQVRGLKGRLFVAAKLGSNLISFPGKKRTPYHGKAKAEPLSPCKNARRDLCFIAIYLSDFFGVAEAVFALGRLRKGARCTTSCKTVCNR